MSDYKTRPNVPIHGQRKHPIPGTLDHVASQRIGGWDPNSQKPALFHSGALSFSIEEFRGFLIEFVERIRKSEYSKWLGPIENVEEVPWSEIFIDNPVNEELVAIGPERISESGIIPFAAYWQSGWASALPHVFVRESVLLKLENVARKLKEVDPSISIGIMDGWRSVDQQQDLYDSFYPDGYKSGDPIYVSKPERDSRKAAPHPSGGAVDVFICIDGKPIDLGTPFDFMDDEANTIHFETEGSDELIRSLRRILSNAMADEGFVPIDSEWWHFEYGTRRWAAKTGNEPLYGNIDVDQELLSQLVPVVALPFSNKGREMESRHESSPGFDRSTE